VLREQLRKRPLRLDDDQRRRLAAKAKVLGRRILAEVATIVTPGWMNQQQLQVIDYLREEDQNALWAAALEPVMAE
jgi:hypothetical protein